MEMRPFSVACPRCGVPAGKPCMTKQDYRAYPTHGARWKAVGIAKPTSDEKDADQADWRAYDERRDAANMQRWLAERAAADMATKAGHTPGSPDWRQAVRLAMELNAVQPA